jgi:hypothetical protein
LIAPVVSGDIGLGPDESDVVFGVAFGWVDAVDANGIRFAAGAWRQELEIEGLAA